MIKMTVSDKLPNDFNPDEFFGHLHDLNREEPPLHKKYLDWLRTWDHDSISFQCIEAILSEAELATKQGGGINYNHMVAIIERTIRDGGFYDPD